MESKQELKRLPKGMKRFSILSNEEISEITRTAQKKLTNVEIFNFANTELEHLIARMFEAANNGHISISLTEDEDKFMRLYSGIFFYNYVYTKGIIAWSNDENSVVTTPEFYMYTPEMEDKPKQKTFIWKGSSVYECIRQNGEYQRFATLSEFYNSDW